MSEPASHPGKTATVPGGKALPPPFLLTTRQGEAARSLLSYVVSLPFPGPDSQLLAVVAAIRAARGGVGNLTGMDLSALRLGDPREAVDALRSLGWQVDEAIFDSGPDAPPVPVTVPDLARRTGHPLPLGKHVRSRVSGWTTRTLSAKPVRKLPPEVRLAGLFLAAHSTSGLLGQVPSSLPDACRAALPTLLDKGFLTELSGDRYRLDPQVRHLSGMRPPTGEERAAEPATVRAKDTGVRPGFEFSPDAWARWKTEATPALGRHVDSVERCALCALPPERVAEAFMRPFGPAFFSTYTKSAYARWKDAHPDRGPQAARFTVFFRAGHGHGPSFRQLCKGLGWTQNHQGRGFVVERLLLNGWLTSTGEVPWTLRPGPAAQEQGITLPRARSSAARADAARP
ncbi:hypothetical protein OG705_29500 [Streptomyces sp. NBC_00838]|uniref:hypothetical protein n=1 Tax=Streptomyces sp. NBC_00838 TaxID=2903680 RepID=UPI00386FFDD7|nr:hypothetical protein OG705_29500 [Streptomyces sp. NBC_00838]